LKLLPVTLELIQIHPTKY